MMFSLIIVLLFQTAYSAPAARTASRMPTLLVSLDGFRADSLDKFLETYPESNMNKYLVKSGVKADYMIPSFPSLTFPNHYTLVTGRFMENHGIVGNTFYDPNYDEKVNLIGDSKSKDIRFWNQSEPIWETAKKQGLKTASFFWTGSEVWGKHPDIFLSYTDAYDFNSRCDEIANWFNKFDLDFATLYFNEPDKTGHTYGPDSEEYRQAIVKMDEVLGYLFKRLDEIGYLNKLNIIVTSDHGMATMNAETIIVSQVIDEKLVNTTKTVYGIVSNVYPINEASKEQVYNAFKQAKNLKVYYKEEVPEYLHYRLNDRIGPIVVIADDGYVLNRQKQTLKGNHAFDPIEVSSMRTIFMARGPSFKEQATIKSINNVDIYPLLCQLIDVKCNKHDGNVNNLLGALRTNSANLISSRPASYLFIFLSVVSTLLSIY